MNWERELTKLSWPELVELLHKVAEEIEVRAMQDAGED